MMMKIAFWVAMFTAATCACGGARGSEDGGDYGFIDGPPPKDAVLCTLQIGVATRADAIAALGQPTSSVDSASVSTLDYTYGDPQTVEFGDIRSMSLDFDERGLFSDATVINMSLPSCWREQLARGAQ